MRPLHFYLDYISSNAYLAWVRMPELAERHGLRVQPVPVVFAKLLESTGSLGPAEVRPKAAWMWRNCQRKAALLGVPLRPPAFHPFNPLLALRVSSLDMEDDARTRLVDGLFRAVWADGLHVSEPDVVAKLADGLGLDGAGLVARAGEPDAKARLRRQTDDAIARGVFGVPTMEAEDELFFGYDDLPYLEMVLAGEDPVDPEEKRRWREAGPTPPRHSAMRRQFRDDLPPTWKR